MPRKYSLKFGGTVDAEAPIPPVVLIGILLCCVVFCGIASGLIGYYGFIRETCKDKDSDGNLKYDDLCPPGNELHDGTCDDECDISTCCKEYNCNPPTSLPRGYKLKSGQSLSTTTYKSISDFESNPSLSSKVECDTNYAGAPVATSCAGNSDKKWSLSGCELSGIESCTTGANPHDNGHGGHKPRLEIDDCSEIDLDHLYGDNKNIQQQIKCDSRYQSNGKFCKWIRDNLNSCTESETSCALP